LATIPTAEIEVALLLPGPGSRRTRRDLYEQLKTAIRSGRLAPGLRMPASRALAGQLGISRNTVIAVYELLLSEGDISTRPGSGAYVAEREAPAPRPPTNADMVGRIAAPWRAWRPTRPPPPASRHFTMGSPDLGLFPWDLWRRITNRSLRTYSRAPLAHFGLAGAPVLREAIAGHLSFARGVACGSGDIVVTSGSQQAFDLLAKLLIRRPGVVVAVEDPGYGPARQSFAMAGAAVVGVPVDEEGIVVEALQPDVELIYVTPSHQFPLGVPMSPRRRRALLDFAERTGAVVIEDDYDGEFRFDGRPLEALQTLDASGRVIYVGTFSKSLFPDLRVGFVVAPEWIRGPLTAAKLLSDGRTSLTAQIALAAFIGEGHLTRHVRRMRRIYGDRRKALLEGIAGTPAGWLAPYPSAAGLHLSLRLPGEVDPKALLAAAAELGVGAYPLSQFTHGEAHHNGISLGYGALGEEDVRVGARTLADIAARLALA
jgi:GntR family transcriptional regulator/MocR family aminotransferase